VIGWDETIYQASTEPGRRFWAESADGRFKGKQWFDDQLGSIIIWEQGGRWATICVRWWNWRASLWRLLVWGPACYALKDRDLWIGWSATQRVERLKLIVQNRRFLLLRPRASLPIWLRKCWRRPCARCRAVAGMFRLPSLVAESFTDPEAYEGTCYKASNWEPVGWSAGYSRHRADFYVANERPRNCGCARWPTKGASSCGRWNCRPIVARGDRRSFRAVAAVAAASGFVGRGSAPGARPRDSNTQYRTGPVLTIIALALLAGGGRSRDRPFCTTLTHPSAAAWDCRSRKHPALLQGSRYSVFYQLLTRMDPEAFATLLSGWLASRAGSLRRLWPWTAR